MDPRYCFDCRWLRYETPDYRCGKTGAHLGGTVLGREACPNFTPFYEAPSAAAGGPAAYMELKNEERELLIAVLEDRLGTLREQIYHSEDPGFKDSLRRTRDQMAGLLLKLKEQIPV